MSDANTRETVQMPWLDQPLQRIAERYRDGRLPHALLIRGGRGIGKRRFAEVIAGLLLCSQPTGSRACGQCRQCLLVQAGSHSDLRTVTPDPERKTPIISIAQIRSLTEFAFGSAQVAHRKVAIIDRADQLNINAANALLKTLEEPPEDVTLLLVQESGRPLLPTINSRCQQILMACPGDDEALQWLKTSAGPDADPDSLRRALALAGGAPRLALEMLSSGIIECQTEAEEGFRRFLKSQQSVSDTSCQFKKLELEGALALMDSWLLQMARLAAGGDESGLPFTEVLKYLVSVNPPHRIYDLLEATRETRRTMTYNANPELEIQRLLFYWKALMPARKERSPG